MAFNSARKSTEKVEPRPRVKQVTLEEVKGKTTVETRRAEPPVKKEHMKFVADTIHLKNLYEVRGLLYTLAGGVTTVVPTGVVWHQLLNVISVHSLRQNFLYNMYNTMYFTGDDSEVEEALRKIDDQIIEATEQLLKSIPDGHKPEL